MFWAVSMLRVSGGFMKFGGGFWGMGGHMTTCGPHRIPRATQWVVGRGHLKRLGFCGIRGMSNTSLVGGALGGWVGGALLLLGGGLGLGGLHKNILCVHGMCSRVLCTF